MKPFSILRFGPGTEDVRKALLEDANGEDAIEISNPYFSATVRCLSVDHPAVPHGLEDGIIALYTDTETYEQYGDLVRMKLAYEHKEHEAGPRVLDCLDRGGFEYVAPVDLNVRTSPDREKEGFPRIVEALQGTVWSTAVRKKTLQEVAREQEEEGGESAVAVDEKEPVSSDDAVKEESIEVAESPEKDVSQTLGLQIPEPSTEAEESPDMRQLEQLMGQVSKLRTEAQSGSMSDDRRRERAAEAATLLLGLMGDDDGESDDE